MRLRFYLSLLILVVSAVGCNFFPSRSCCHVSPRSLSCTDSNRHPAHVLIHTMVPGTRYHSGRKCKVRWGIHINNQTVYTFPSRVVRSTLPGMVSVFLVAMHCGRAHTSCPVTCAWTNSHHAKSIAGEQLRQPRTVYVSMAS